MPYRKLASEALSEVFSALAHPERVRIVEELGQRELDVASLQEILELGQARVSRHLAVLRAAHLVKTRPEGRRIWYSLQDPELATWAAHGLHFVGMHGAHYEAMKQAAEQAAKLWLKEPEAQGEAPPRQEALHGLPKLEPPYLA